MGVMFEYLPHDILNVPKCSGIIIMFLLLGYAAVLSHNVGCFRASVLMALQLEHYPDAVEDKASIKYTQLPTTDMEFTYLT